MASVSLFSVGKTILEKLSPLVQQEAVLLWNFRAELNKLNGTVTSIHVLLLDAEEQQEHSHQVKDWVEKLTVLLFDAEDLLDDVATEALRDELEDSNCRVQCSTAVRFLFISLPNRLIYGLRMAHRVKSLRIELDALYDDTTKLHLTPRFEEKGKMRKHTRSISSIPEVVVGREDDVTMIKNLLLLADSRSNAVSVVTIVGIGGMGKTTLAQLIYNDEEIEDEFELRLWVCVSEAFEVKSIVQKILESATETKPQDLELDTLISLLDREISKGRRYLLVLDDVWNFVPEKWDVLRSVLKTGARNGSKILVTTRFEKYARMMMSHGSPPPYALSGLSSPESWSLLRQIAFADDDDDEKLQCIVNEEEIRTLIMEKSAGVPLAVKTMANLLHFRNPRTEWLPFLRSSELLGAEQEGSILHNLKLSYDYLPSHLKHCFLLCVIYPKNYDIPVQTMIHSWSALGLIKLSPNDSEQSVFDSGLKLFMDLAWRSFFDVKRGHDGTIQSGRIHDLIHELAVSIVGGGSSYRQVNNPTDKLTETTYHISLDHDLWSPVDLLGRLDEAKRLQTFHLMHREWYRSESSWDDSTFESFVSKVGRLRALDFVGSGMETIPDKIRELKHLRYLNLSCTEKITRLPNSITTLQNLQVLILHECRSLVELPSDVNKLVNLWHLDCSHCFALTHMPNGLARLTRLEKLTWFTVRKDSQLGGLDELNILNNLGGILEIVNLRYLRGGGDIRGSHAFEIGSAANLKAKFRLEWLLLEWDDGNPEKREEGEWEEWLKDEESGRDAGWDESLLESFQPHSNLKAFTVVGYKGWRSPGWISSLTNLATLHIKCSNVRYGLHHLQALPLLQKLLLSRLIELNYVDEDEDGDSDSDPSKPFFLRLEYLHLHDCPKLKGWRRKQQPPQFPKLSKLIIDRCPLMSWMPSFPTLDDQLILIDSGLQPLLDTLNYCMPPSSSSSVQHPLSKLKKLEIWRVHHPPKDWLHGMQHLTSLQEIVIHKCSGLEETLDWHNISHVPNVYVAGDYVTKDGESVFDEDDWKYFSELILMASEADPESAGQEDPQMK